MSENGATLTETCLLAALVVVVCIASIGVLGSQAEETFVSTCASMKKAEGKTQASSDTDEAYVDQCRGARSGGSSTK